MLDTGDNIPESIETLRLQQGDLISGHRHVQMFPVGTEELDLPQGMERVTNARGVFHYNPTYITRDTILDLSEIGCENIFLNLGPFSKFEIDERLRAGEIPVGITEYTHDGVEVRAAAGTSGTKALQLAYFELTKRPDATVVLELPRRVLEKLR